MENEFFEIDKKMEEIEKSIDLIINETKNINIIGTSLKQHNSQNKINWQNYQSVKFNEILNKCNNLDNILKKIL